MLRAATTSSTLTTASEDHVTRIEVIGISGSCSAYAIEAIGLDVVEHGLGGLAEIHRDLSLRSFLGRETIVKVLLREEVDLDLVLLVVLALIHMRPYTK